MKTRFTIFGQPASKSNRRRAVTIKGKPAFIKSAEALAFEKSMLLQVPPTARKMLAGNCAVRMRIFYRNNRSDLDESVILDCLQARYSTVTLPNREKVRTLVQRGVVVNDRQFKRKFIYHEIDPINPRVEIVIWELLR